MNDKILTVIIPSYNTERFIRKNIPTFIADEVQNYLEVIIINDGSSDNTESIAKDIVRKYPNIVRLISKDNGGHGSTINLGIKEAQGKYFKVVDGDDWVETEGIVQLIKDLKKTDSDVIVNHIYTVSYKTGERKLEKVDNNSYGNVVSFDSVANKYTKMGLHALTFRTKLLRDNNIRVRENCYYEDNEYSLFPIKYVKTICFFDYPIYNYLIDQIDQSVNRLKALKNIDMYYQVTRDCISFYNSLNEGVSNPKKEYVERSVFEIVRGLYNVFLRAPADKQIYLQLKKYNSRLEEEFPAAHIKVREKYRYIGFLQNGGVFSYYVLSASMRLYKMIRR